MRSKADPELIRSEAEERIIDVFTWLLTEDNLAVWTTDIDRSD
jgi:hypothetical protein